MIILCQNLSLLSWLCDSSLILYENVYMYVHNMCRCLIWLVVSILSTLACSMQTLNKKTGRLTYEFMVEALPKRIAIPLPKALRFLFCSNHGA